MDTLPEDREAYHHAARLLNRRAAALRTPNGRHQAEWHESDANMVAGELERQASAILALAAKPSLVGEVESTGDARL